MLVGTGRVFVVRVAAPGHVSQRAPVSGTVLAPAGAVGQAVVARSAARLMAECIVAAGDEAPVEFLPRRRVAGAVTDVDIRVAHGAVVAGIRSSFWGSDASESSTLLRCIVRGMQDS